MEADEIEIFDWGRVFLGDVSTWFLLEVVIRIVVIYLILIVTMRLMGTRMAAMLTRNELIALVSLAAAIGVPMQDPTRGLLPAMVIAGVVVVLQRGISKWSSRNADFETLVLGDMGPLLTDGRFHLDEMEKTRVSRVRIMSELRSKGLVHMGQAQRVYLEANGEFTIFTFKEKKKGLSIIPAMDQEFRDEQTIAEGSYACGNCGNVTESKEFPKHKCQGCGISEWNEAIEA